MSVRARADTNAAPRGPRPVPLCANDFSLVDIIAEHVGIGLVVVQEFRFAFS